MQNWEMVKIQNWEWYGTLDMFQISDHCISRIIVVHCTTSPQNKITIEGYSLKLWADFIKSCWVCFCVLGNFAGYQLSSIDPTRINESWPCTLQSCFRAELSAYFPLFLGRSTAWILGRTPPAAMVTFPRSLFSSSSFLTASVICLGTIRLFLLSRAAFPASSRISAQRYSRTAAR